MEARDRHLRAFGMAIRERRLQLGLSQEAAAQRWGVGPAWLSNVERGQANPGFRSMLALAASMEVSLATLFRRADRLAKADDDRG